MRITLVKRLDVFLVPIHSNAADAPELPFTSKSVGRAAPNMNSTYQYIAVVESGGGEELTAGLQTPCRQCFDSRTIPIEVFRRL